MDSESFPLWDSSAPFSTHSLTCWNRPQHGVLRVTPDSIIETVTSYRKHDPTTVQPTRGRLIIEQTLEVQGQCQVISLSCHSPTSASIRPGEDHPRFRQKNRSLTNRVMVRTPRAPGVSTRGNRFLLSSGPHCPGVNDGAPVVQPTMSPLLVV